MKNIAIIPAIIFVFFTFSSTSFAEKIDVSEKAVKTSILRGTINKWCQEIGGVNVDKIYNVRIEAKSQQSTPHGLLNFYALTAEMKVKNHKFYVVALIYTGEKEDNEMYRTQVTYAAPQNEAQMQGFERILARHKKTVVEKSILAKAGLELAVL